MDRARVRRLISRDKARARRKAIPAAPENALITPDEWQKRQAAHDMERITGCYKDMAKLCTSYGVYGDASIGLQQWAFNQASAAVRLSPNGFNIDSVVELALYALKMELENNGKTN